MSNVMRKICGILILLAALYVPYYVHARNWDDTTIQSLPDSSFAMVEVKKDGTKVRHLAYKDIQGHIDMSRVIYCLGTFSDEIWICPEKKDIARKRLEEHYNKFRLKQAKEGIETAVNINTAGLKELIRLPGIGPVTAVNIYRFRENHGFFTNIEDVAQVEGIGPAIFAGIKYYITVR